MYSYDFIGFVQIGNTIIENSMHTVKLFSSTLSCIIFIYHCVMQLYFKEIILFLTALQHKDLLNAIVMQKDSMLRKFFYFT